MIKTSAYLNRKQILEQLKNAERYKEEKYKGYLFATYISPTKNLPALIVFQGKKNLPESRKVYRSVQLRDDALDKYKLKADDEYQDIEERQLEKKDYKHDFQKGDILISSWGYDQTNISFYVVEKVLTPKSIEIQQIGTKIIGREPYGDDLVVPDETRKKDHKMKKIVQMGRVKIDSYSSAYKWNGKPASQTPFGLGH